MERKVGEQAGRDDQKRQRHRGTTVAREEVLAFLFSGR